MERLAALSDKGRRRRNNEDSIGTAETPLGLLLVVADGVGGERAGEVASREATSIIIDRLASDGGSSTEEQLREAIEQANQAVWSRSQADPRLRGMATTVVAAIVRDDSALIANVGDSRAYLLQDSEIQQVTQDHSLVAERVREGDITDEEARTSRARHIITRSVGSDEQLEVDIFGPLRLPAGSRLLLCSDGLTDVVEEPQIAAVAGIEPPGEAARHLVDLANEQGGPDNISVIIYEAGAAAGAAKVKKSAATVVEPPDRYRIAGITAGIAAIAATIGAGVLLAGALTPGGAGQSNALAAGPPIEPTFSVAAAVATPGPATLDRQASAAPPLHEAVEPAPGQGGSAGGGTAPETGSPENGQPPATTTAGLPGDLPGQPTTTPKRTRTPAATQTPGPTHTPSATATSTPDPCVDTTASLEGGLDVGAPADAAARFGPCSTPDSPHQ
jgi:protein phosphatase